MGEKSKSGEHGIVQQSCALAALRLGFTGLTLRAMGAANAVDATRGTRDARREPGAEDGREHPADDDLGILNRDGTGNREFGERDRGNEPDDQHDDASNTRGKHHRERRDRPRRKRHDRRAKGGTLRCITGELHDHEDSQSGEDAEHDPDERLVDAHPVEAEDKRHEQGDRGEQRRQRQHSRHRKTKKGRDRRAESDETGGSLQKPITLFGNGFHRVIITHRHPLRGQDTAHDVLGGPAATPG